MQTADLSLIARSVDADHDGGGFDDRQGVLAGLQTQLCHGVVGDGGGDGEATQDAEAHDAVHRALL